MNSQLNNYMQETTPVTDPIDQHNTNDGVLTAAHFSLEKFCKEAIASNVKGFVKLTELAKTHGINRSYRTLIDLVKKYKTGGLTALKRKEYSGKGDTRSFSDHALRILQKKYIDCLVIRNAYEDMHKELRKIAQSFIDVSTGEEFLIKDNLLHEMTGGTAISIHSTKFVECVYRLPGYDESRINNEKFQVRAGSYKSACRYLSALKENEPALFMNRFGIHDYRNKRQHPMKLSYSHLNPNYYLVGDGKQLDIIVISEDWRRVYRPWLMGWYDMATRRYCYELAVHEDSESIANSLAVAIREWGVPEKVKTDNGSSYTSGRFDEMCKFFNVEQHHATVKLARAKPIESHHNVIDNLCKSSIGYTGGKYVDMPLDTRERIKLALGAQRDAKKYAKLIKENIGFSFTIADPDARLKKSKRRLMHISELNELLSEKFDEYHERTHGGLKKDKLGKQVYNLNCKDELINEYGEKLNSPRGRYQYYVQQGFKPVTADPAIVALYASNFDLRTVQFKTGINLANGEYFDAKLLGVAGKKVLIRYTSPGAMNIYVFTSDELQKISDRKQLTHEIHQGLKFICIAKRQEIIDYDDPRYKDELILQRAEERSLRESLGITKYGAATPYSREAGGRPQDGVAYSNIIQLNPASEMADEIKQAEKEIIANKKPSSNKYKDVDLY